jgi:nicotinamidase-related amidase
VSDQASPANRDALAWFLSLIRRHRGFRDGSRIGARLAGNFDHRPRLADARLAVAGFEQSVMVEAHSSETISHAVHLSIDMQNIFSSGGIWPTPWMERVTPGIARLVAHDAARTVLTRFITPVSADDRPGRWQRYFERWDCATQPRLPPGALDVISPLARFIPPATVIDKPGYSAFFASALQSFLAEKNISTLIITGSETDVCVLATILDAVDRGFRVVVVEDGLCSSSNQGHDALMMLYRTRFTDQIELLALDAVLDLWREAS